MEFHVTDSSDTPFPLLSEIVTPGNPSHARQAQGHDDEAHKQPSSVHETGHAAGQEPASAADAGPSVPGDAGDDDDFDLPTLSDRIEHEPEHEHVAGTPVVEHDEPPVLGDIISEAQPPHPGVQPAPEASEASEVPEASGDTSIPSHALDADLIAERLRGRFEGFLAGEGREVIEARCREALHDHTAWLVSQITREVALELETRVTDWVREAVSDELSQREKGA